MTRVIGLTGGIASGKSTVSRMLATAGLPIVDADQVVRTLQQPSSQGLQALEQAFGRNIITATGELDRSALGQLVFNDDQQRNKLNRIMQPMVWNEIWQEVDQFRKQGIPWVVLDVPLLIEEHYDRDCDLVIVVAVDRAIQRQRLMDRNHLTVDQAEARIVSQMSLEEKKRHADIVIDNNGNLQKLRQQVEAVLKRLKEQ
ncbi:dephospho-CoA kinase [Limosilactobacillus frumenti DSM 13145]|uniref:Dephospho-CoA kinase n=1 Tax=Limosilactobacillus frumenti DSM 13145 TaxID=1423746 RepID=A0A0R1PB88_9LACO|nr:dephospho-CoA kinase [Limosilactobacillus frumenti]KRL27410.1 dephospho-CoA kinase [Limosilactobacillus frumenti DSM 13145]MBA2913310.1 dephospho-CoA kinase [Limosilactobacillus frumenti]QFG72850.1 dephospho-CoA kinase [Limosilactobacillus frumenti]